MAAVMEDVRDGIPAGLRQDAPVLVITDTAKEKIHQVLSSQEPPLTTIRVTSPYRGRYAMNLEPEGKPELDDTVLPYSSFQVLVDSDSMRLVEGATLEWVDTDTGGGFQFSNPNDTAGEPQPKQAPEGPEGEIWRQIQDALDNEVNPAVASHGGRISLMDYQDGTVFVKMSGGCQGCGQASATLKQGVEKLLRERIPSITEVLDTTDHAGGRNPYYAP
jgi:Fe/S biogenesis protein NfuA